MVATLAQGGVDLLLTSRRHPAGLAGEFLFPPHALDGVGVKAGASLFIHLSSRAKQAKEAQALAEQVATVTEGHPLAIALLAAEWDLSTEIEAEDFLANWDEELAAARRPGMAAHHVTFATAFRRSFDHLTEAQQQRLVALRRFPAPFFAEGAALLWQGELPADDAARSALRRELAIFVQRSLLRVDGWYVGGELPATYRLEPVIARALQRQPVVDEAMAQRRYLDYAAWLVRHLREGLNAPALVTLAQQWVDELIPLNDDPSLPEAGWFGWRLATLLYQFGRVGDALPILKRVVQIAVSEEDQRLIALSTHDLAQVHRTRGDLTQAMALYEETLAILEQVGDLQGKGATLHNMAQVHVTRGELTQAMALYEASLAIREQVGDLPGKGATLSGMANILMSHERWDEAEELLHESLRIAQQVNSPADFAFNIVKLGQVAQARGDTEEARQRYHEGLRIFEQLGMPEANQVRHMLAALDGGSPPSLSPDQVLLALTQTATAAAQGQQPVAAVAAACEQLAASDGLPAEHGAYLGAVAAALHHADDATLDALTDAAGALPHDVETMVVDTLPRFYAALGHADRAIALQHEGIARLRPASNPEAALALSVALFNQSGYLATAERFDEAVAALEEVVALDEQWALPDLESDRAALDRMIRRRDGLPLEEAESIPLTAEMLHALTNLTPQQAAALTPPMRQLHAQLASLSEEERAQLDAALQAAARQFAALSDDEREAVALAAQRQQIEALAAQIVDAALHATRQGNVAALLPTLEEAAATYAQDETPDSPFDQLARFTRAVIAKLGGQPLPPVPEPYLEQFAAFQAAIDGM